MNTPGQPQSSLKSNVADEAGRRRIAAVQFADAHLPRFKGKGYLLTRLLPNEGYFDVSVEGVNLNLNLGDSFERGALVGRFEAEVIGALAKEMKAGETFCDCGGHIGIVSLLIAQRLGRDGTVVAFEPAPPTFARLQQNFDRNPHLKPRLFANFQAVGAAPEEGVPMFVSSRDGWSTLSQEASAVGVGLGEVVASVHHTTITTLDEFFLGDGAQIKPPAAIKIDVEGWELEVLQGGAQLLSRQPPRIIVMEKNEPILQSRGRSFQEVSDLMEGHGYRGTMITAGDIAFRRI